jgi:hypothetical protein
MKPNPRTQVSTASSVASSRRPNRFNSHELVLQPWFLPRASRLAINALIPPDYRNKMRAYFDDYGCMVCEKHELYDSNGMCLRCHHLIRIRLATSVRRRMTGRPDDRIDLIMLRRKALARKLLGRFSQPWKRVALRHRLDPASLRNPVDEALGFLTPGSLTNRHQEFQSGSPRERGILGKSVRDLRTRRPSR